VDPRHPPRGARAARREKALSRRRWWGELSQRGLDVRDYSTMRRQAFRLVAELEAVESGTCVRARLSITSGSWIVFGLTLAIATAIGLALGPELWVWTPALWVAPVGYYVGLLMRLHRSAASAEQTFLELLPPPSLQ